MKRLIRCLLLLLACCVGQQAFAVGVVHIGDGDCAALEALVRVQPGQEPALIVLSRNGRFGCGTLEVNGNIEIDAQGATLVELANSSVSTAPSGIVVNAGATLTLRNAVIGFPPQGLASVTQASIPAPGPKFCCVITSTAIVNSGSLTLDSVTLTGMYYRDGLGAFVLGLIGNSGHLVMRNVSAIDNSYTGNLPALLANTGAVEISQSTFVTGSSNYTQALFSSDGSGVIRIGNSIVANNGYAAAPACASGSGRIVSLGGNVSTDSSCGFDAANDRVVADLRALDLADHGGVVPTLALNYDSPAIKNGLAANCEAVDARGLSRKGGACDSGAYEVAGGNGRISATGMSGLFFNPENNGHYVSIQRLFGNQVLVIWNTFDKNGVPAWVYGVGSLIGGIVRIAVDPVAQNVGGTLQPGGNVVGAKAVAWGAMEVTFDNCYSALLRYASPLPEFGSGETRLTRLAFVDGVDCAY